MKIAIDFDGTIVDDSHSHRDLSTELTFTPGAEAALRSLKAADHILILYSARANLAIRWDWQHNPLWALGLDPSFSVRAWKKQRPLNQARFQQMLDFVETRLPGVFTFIDYGNQGKVLADLFIDDRALKYGGGWRAVPWSIISRTYGDHDDDRQDDSPKEVRSGPNDGRAVSRQVRLSARREVPVR